jgi:hypothetical protein
MADSIKRFFVGLCDRVCNVLLQADALQPGDAILIPDQECWHTQAILGRAGLSAQWRYFQRSDEYLLILFQVVAVKSSNLYYVWRIPSITDKHEYKAICAEHPKSLFDRR